MGTFRSAGLPSSRCGSRKQSRRVFRRCAADPGAVHSARCYQRARAGLALDRTQALRPGRLGRQQRAQASFAKAAAARRERLARQGRQPRAPAATGIVDAAVKFPAAAGAAGFARGRGGAGVARHGPRFHRRFPPAPACAAKFQPRDGGAPARAAAPWGATSPAIVTRNGCPPPRRCAPARPA